MAARLATTKERPTSNRRSFLPYGRQDVRPEDIEAVVAVLNSDFLTQGPEIARFESALASTVGARHAIVCSHGTAALHLAMLALNLGPGDTIVTSVNTFLASANCARYCGAEVLFADVNAGTGNVTPETVAAAIDRGKRNNIKAILPVHFAGQTCDLKTTADVADGIPIVSDACHALGGTFGHGSNQCLLGNDPFSCMSIFSFHPVKHVAMGEGGAITTNDSHLANRLQLFRNHGMIKRDGMPPWSYEMSEVGYNYRVTDLQAALGRSQLARLRQSVSRRRELAARYRSLLEQACHELVRPLDDAGHGDHAYHLFVVGIDFDRAGVERASVMNALRERGIGTQVHYIPVSLQPYYRERYDLRPEYFPGAMTYYSRALSLPLFPTMQDNDVDYVVAQLIEVLERR